MKNMMELKQHYKKLKNQILSSVFDKELDFDGDETDILQAQGLENIQTSLDQRQFQKLRRIDYALSLIEEGTVNECEDCGETIGYKRLLAIPGVRVCISCAEDRERNSK